MRYHIPNTTDPRFGGSSFINCFSVRFYFRTVKESFSLYVYRDAGAFICPKDFSNNGSHSSYGVSAPHSTFNKCILFDSTFVLRSKSFFRWDILSHT